MSFTKRCKARIGEGPVGVAGSSTGSGRSGNLRNSWNCRKFSLLLLGVPSGRNPVPYEESLSFWQEMCPAPRRDGESGLKVVNSRNYLEMIPARGPQTLDAALSMLCYL